MKYLMCNLKANKTLTEILNYKKQIASINLQNKEFVLFPTSIYLSFFYDAPYKIGTQNISTYTTENHTGEILASQLSSLNVSYCLINHCETTENSESCIKKIRNAIRKKIKVVFCIGKELKENDISTLSHQIKEVFDKLTRKEMENIILAYEPCWAINQDDIVDSKMIKETIGTLKQEILKNYNINIEIIYGGSINVDNFHKLLKIDKLDGFLIGNCANNPENIVKIAEMF